MTELTFLFFFVSSPSGRALARYAAIGWLTIDTSNRFDNSTFSLSFLTDGFISAGRALRSGSGHTRDMWPSLPQPKQTIVLGIVVVRSGAEFDGERTTIGTDIVAGSTTDFMTSARRRSWSFSTR